MLNQHERRISHPKHSKDASSFRLSESSGIC
jgi:hypothetical protein